MFTATTDESEVLHNMSWCNPNDQNPKCCKCYVNQFKLVRWYLVFKFCILSDGLISVANDSNFVQKKCRLIILMNAGLFL